MGRYKQREPFHFGVDYFKAYLKRGGWKKSRLDGLSRNSDLWAYDKETHLYFVPNMAIGKYEKYFEIIDRPTGVKMAFVMIGKRDKTGCTERRDIFECTGQGLILRSVGWWVKFIEVLGFEIDGFKRVDICLDILTNTDWVCRNILVPVLEERKSTYRPFIDKGTYTGVGIGEKDPKKNTWKYTRVYNKIEDTEVKGKEFLYQFKEKGVKELTRFELELRRDKCRHFHVEYLTDHDALYKIFNYEVFSMNFQFFKFIHKEDARKVAEAYLIEPFSERGLLNLNAGESKKKALEIQQRSIEYGTEFKDEKAKAKGFTILLTYYRKLLGSGVTWEEIRQVLEGENEKYGLQTHFRRNVTSVLTGKTSENGQK